MALEAVMLHSQSGGMVNLPIGLSLVIIVLVYALSHALYNLFLHPLARFPGPLLARSTLLWRFYHSSHGRFHRVIEKGHQTYGKVFRVSPNELSFASVASWKDIYGPWPGRAPFVKSEFYDMYGAGFGSRCVGSEQDPKTHLKMKTSLANAFSTRALSEQEPIVQTHVNDFVNKICSIGQGSEGIDMTEWFEMIAFDILGEMAFGESFSSVKQGKPHDWQRLIVKHLFFITVADNLRRYSLIRQLASQVVPLLTSSVQAKHGGYSRRLVSKRLSGGSERKDFLSHVVGKVEAGEMPVEEMTAHASTLVIAGGETVATFLAATTYHLCKSPLSMEKLRLEIRSRYSSNDDIDTASAMQLPFLQAVISEALRIYPPGSQGFPRISPGGVVDGVWVPKGTELYTSAWTVTHDPSNFSRPSEFIPDRWLDPDSTDIKDASQPFSLGPRSCLGRNFAYMEISLLLAKMHLRYDMELVDENLDWEGQSHIHVMWWKPKLKVRFSDRDVSDMKV